MFRFPDRITYMNVHFIIFEKTLLPFWCWCDAPTIIITHRIIFQNVYRATTVDFGVWHMSMAFNGLAFLWWIAVSITFEFRGFRFPYIIICMMVFGRRISFWTSTTNMIISPSTGCPIWMEWILKSYCGFIFGPGISPHHFFMVKNMYILISYLE